jgi:hypothetical protein
MAQGFSFKLDPKALRKLARGRGVKAVLTDRVSKVQKAAQDLAPVDTGAYRDGIEGEVEKTQDGFVGRVIATHFTSAWIEFGTARTRAHAPLRRAAESVFGNTQNDEGAR